MSETKKKGANLSSEPSVEAKEAHTDKKKAGSEGRKKRERGGKEPQ